MNIAGPIQKIVGDNASANALLSGRLYPGGRAKQTPAYPYATLQVIGNVPSDTKSGPSTLDQVTVQIAVWSDRYQDAAEAAEAIRGAIDRFVGDVTVGSSTYGIQGVRFLDGRDMPWDPSELYGVGMDFKVRYMRTGVTGVIGTTGLQEYASDADAIADGLESGDFYLLSKNNIYFLKHKILTAVS